MREQRRLAAIMVADVVGYSKLVGRDEAGTLAQLRALQTDVIEPAIAKHAGRLFKAVGDGFLVEFASAVQAVEAAQAIQQANADGELPLRVGIHVGDVVVQGDDLMGDGINVAARIEAVAGAGGIALSRQAYDQVRDRPGVAFEDRGEIELKNIVRPVHVFTIAATGSAMSAAVPALALPDKPSIAVLPFQNMSGDPEQEYFADGMVEEITTLLSRQRWLFVIARTSAFTYKDKMVDLKQVGRELGVRYLLEGSVRKAGNRVRVAAQLIDALSGAHLWADNFDGNVDDIFELHDRIAVEVAGAVEPKLRIAEIERSLRKPTTSLDAYDLYMRASTVFRDPTPDNLQVALGLTEQALERDSHFARVLALRAACILHLGDKYGPEAASEALRLAHAALAVSSDDSEATAFAAMTIALMGGSIDTALWASQQALLINPSGFSALTHSGWVYCAAGTPAGAIEPFTLALRLSPRDPLRGYCELGLANAHRDLRHPEDALVWARRAILSLPRLAGGYRVAAAALVDLGRVDEAKEFIAQLLKILPQSRIDPVFVRRQNRNSATIESTIAALRLAGLPD
jgi:adenylate cyclase